VKTGATGMTAELAALIADWISVPRQPGQLDRWPAVLVGLLALDRGCHEGSRRLAKNVCATVRCGCA
jgi:hypothetical protein